MSLEEVTSILAAVGEVKTEIAATSGEVKAQISAIRAGHGARLKAIDEHMKTSNGVLESCTEEVQDHDTRLALVEAVQTNMTEGWTIMQQRCQTHVERTGKIERTLIKVAIASPVFSLIGGGLVKWLDGIGIL